MKNIRFLDELKIRGSYASTGNQGSLYGNQNPNGQIGFYDYIQNVDLGSGGPVLGPYTSRTVTAGPNGTLVSLDRTWERIKNTNIGVDYAVLRNRLYGSFDYYWKQNNNMLLPQTYSVVLGATAR